MKIKLLILHVLFIFFTITSSSPSPPPLNFTTFGSAIVDHNSITLTQNLNNSISNFGRVFYKNPIQFHDSSGTSSLSFFTSFSFTITPPPPPYLSGEGLAFLLTSNPNALSHSVGRIGLPESLDNNTLDDSSFLAVEFDTSFDQGLGDLNNNHVRFDLDSLISKASVDLKYFGIDLKSGKQITVWILYRHSQKIIAVRVSYSKKIKEAKIIVVAQLDLLTRRNGSMYVGFSAANGRGSSIHSIDRWYFKAKESDFFRDEDLGFEDCLICFPEGKEEDEICFKTVVTFILLVSCFMFYRKRRNRVQNLVVERNS